MNPRKNERKKTKTHKKIASSSIMPQNCIIHLARTHERMLPTDLHYVGTSTVVMMTGRLQRRTLMMFDNDDQTTSTERRRSPVLLVWCGGGMGGNCRRATIRSRTMLSSHQYRPPFVNIVSCRKSGDDFLCVSTVCNFFFR